MQKIQLKRSAEYKRKFHYPWIFRDDVELFPSQSRSGEIVEIQNSQKEFYCFAYVNPESQIPFRVLSYSSADAVYSEEFFIQRVMSAWKVRHQSGRRGSFRLVFSESDFLPGLICDLYRVKTQQGEKQFLAMQILTYGMSQLLQDPLKMFAKIVKEANQAAYTDLDWDQTGIILRNDVSVREKEGLRVDEPSFAKSFQNFEPQKAKILLQDIDDQLFEMECDLYQGQKTGFFLDQHNNILRVGEFARKYFKHKTTIRVLDLCSYVGHWSSQLVRALQNVEGKPRNIEIHLGDVSESALQYAKINVQRQIQSETCTIQAHKVDVLRDLGKLENGSFDLIIADPPGFIKAKKDMENGKGAYIRLNAESFRLASSDAIVVSCSCSGLLEEDEFFETVAKGLFKSGRRARMIMKGGPTVDHPGWPKFPQSQYLKMGLFILDR